ncbi:RusA family crossover junction endodeoxyribonuclease, partial [Clostridioides difficile]
KVEGLIRPNKKPDLDNIIKSVADSLNGIAYKDDSQIVEVVSKKYYSDRPRVEVELEDII